MKVYRIGASESVNLNLEAGTVIVVEDDSELLDLFVNLAYAPRGGIVEQKLEPLLRGSILRINLPEAGG